MYSTKILFLLRYFSGRDWNNIVVHFWYIERKDQNAWNVVVLVHIFCLCNLFHYCALWNLSKKEHPCYNWVEVHGCQWKMSDYFTLVLEREKRRKYVPASNSGVHICSLNSWLLVFIANTHGSMYVIKAYLNQWFFFIVLYFIFCQHNI